MALLDVNALVALAWDSHIHHAARRKWFNVHSAEGWETCATTEAGFTRVSSNARVVPGAIAVEDARGVLLALCRVGAHRFLANDVSLTDADLPRLTGHRQVTDAQLLTLGRRNGVALVTFDSAIVALAEGTGVDLLPSM